MKDQSKVQDFKTLIFRVGKEEYGVLINQVVSIERMQPISSYPNRPPHVLGVTSIRNVVTPVVDLRSALTGVEIDPTADQRIVIVQVQDKEIALVVDAATDVLDIDSNTIQHPNLLDGNDVTYLKGISKLEERLIILLDIEQLLEDMTNLDELREIINEL